MKVVFAEKPSVARDYARILGAKTSRDGYIEGKGFAVTWGFGHLVTLVDAKEYDEKFGKWRLEDLPILPEDFKLKVTDDGAKQFNTIKKLFNEATEIVNGGDAGREGELIFRYIYSKSGSSAPIRRLWISSLTDESIKEGFAKLEPGDNYNNLFYAGQSRGEADWLFGINGSRALTLSSRSKKALSVGRVQTPVLCMIAKRFLENQNFVSKPYYVPALFLEKDQIKFKTVFKGRFDTEEEGKKLLEEIKDEIECTKAVRKKKKENQPLLYDLTTLQADANKKHKFTAQKTLDIMQNLYERHKVLTYPRTDSRYITKDILKTIPDLFGKVKSFSRYASTIDKIDTAKLPTRCVNDKKVTDHHAIIPTGKKPEGLSSEESKIFALVLKQFIAAFSPLCIKDTTSLEFKQDKHIFTASGSIIVEAGWREIFLIDKQQNKDDDEDDDKPEKDEEQELPNVEKGDMLPVKERKLDAKKTKAPAIYNEASLLKAMETAGKELDDDEARQAMKDSGLGTPATRAGIIETLIRRNFIERKKSKLLATDLGVSVYENVKDFDFASPSLTGEWEKKLNLMSHGDYGRDSFIEEVKGFTGKVVIDLKSIGENLDTGDLKCPKCKGLVRSSDKAFFCENFPKEEDEGRCTFAVSFKIANKKVSPKQLSQVIKDGVSDKIITGFKKKDGSGTFDAFLEIKEDFRVGFKFENSYAKPKIEKLASCPKCEKGEIHVGTKSYFCNQWKEGCDFQVQKELAGKKLTKESVSTLITQKETELIKGFVSPKSGKEFDSHLILDKQFKLKFRLPETQDS